MKTLFVINIGLTQDQIIIQDEYYSRKHLKTINLLFDPLGKVPLAN